MRKYLMVLVCILFLVLGFLGGHATKGYEVRTYVAEAHEHLNEAAFLHSLVQVRACMLALDGHVMHFVNRPDPTSLYEMAGRMGRCQGWLDEAAKRSDLVVERGEQLGIVNLFYSGFKETIFEVLEREGDMRLLYQSGQSSEELQDLMLQQQRDIHELRKFRDRIEYEIIESW